MFESQLLTETFRGSAQARPKQALHVTSILEEGTVRESATPSSTPNQITEQLGHVGGTGILWAKRMSLV